MGKMSVFEFKWDFSGYAIREAKTGWILEGWSKVQGTTTDYKYLIPYGTAGYQKGQDLKASFNDYLSIGEYLMTALREDRLTYKTLKKGYMVQ
jgi:hypothetical protein